MVMDFSCAFFADIKRRVYFELPTKDPPSINGIMVGKLKNASLTETGFTTSLRFSGV